MKCGFAPPHSLINKLKPGIIKKLNRHATPIAGLVSVGYGVSVSNLVAGVFIGLYSSKTPPTHQRPLVSRVAVSSPKSDEK